MDNFKENEIFWREVNSVRLIMGKLFFIKDRNRNLENIESMWRKGFHVALKLWKGGAKTERRKQVIALNGEEVLKEVKQ